MNFDSDQWNIAALALGMIRDRETGEIKWPVVIGGLLAAGIAGAITMTIAVNADLSAVKARQQVVFERLSVIETSSHPATAKRYTSDDAARDLELIRMRIRDSRDECRRDNDDLKQRIQRMEDRGRR